MSEVLTKTSRLGRQRLGSELYVCPKRYKIWNITGGSRGHTQDSAAMAVLEARDIQWKDGRARTW